MQVRLTLLCEQTMEFWTRRRGDNLGAWSICEGRRKKRPETRRGYGILAIRGRALAHER